MRLDRTRLRRGALLGAIALCFASLAPSAARADEPAPPPPPPPAPLPEAMPPPGSPPAPQAAPPTWTAAQLQELVGPIALYPDVVLASLLPATNFPLDVVSAARWVDAQGGRPAAAPDEQAWDASVKALIQFPDVLKWMSDNLEWIEQMGTAVAYQQADVLAAIQEFRRAARAAGNLATDDHLKVVEERPADAPPTASTVIVLEPTRPDVVYCPTYDPYVISRPCYEPGYCGLTYGTGYYVGQSGAWAWHDLRWGWWAGASYLGWGLYLSSSYYYWGLPRPAGWYVGPYRPLPWYAPYRTSSWRYPPRSIYGPSRMSYPYAAIYRSGRDSYAVRPPTDPRPPLRSIERTYRSSAGSSYVAQASYLAGAGGARRLATTRLASPSPTVSSSPWAGAEAATGNRRASRSYVAPRTTPAPTTGSGFAPSTLTRRTTSYVQSSGTTIPTWSTRGNASLRTTPRSTTFTAPRVTPSVQPRVQRSTYSHASPMSVPRSVPSGNVRSSSSRGHSSLYGSGSQPPSGGRSSGGRSYEGGTRRR